MDSWTEDRPFKDRFLELFKIARNKHATVADLAIKLQEEVQWNIEWSRPPNTDFEWLQWSGLLKELNKIKSLTGKDRWGWVNEKWDEFLVAGVKELINKQSVTEQEDRWIHWNSWVPAKIIYFTWRVGIGRIPAKKELRRRGVLLDNYICSRCRIMEETTEHLINECMGAVSVWKRIIGWMKLPATADISSCKKTLAYADDLKGSVEWKKIIKVIMQATMWHLWKARNEKEFSGITRSEDNTVDDIKTDTFLWLKSRSKLKDLVWERWEDFNIRDIVK
ncbi:putative reverse transcriptase zinc-binding domain-containing protein [Helianthus anomalus]